MVAMLEAHAVVSIFLTRLGHGVPAVAAHAF